MASLQCTLGTDVAHLVLFHPADLAHRAEDPVAWYGYEFAYSKESKAGRLIAFGTGSDGGYAVRLTTEGLTPEEEARACTGWAFPLQVRHGRVLLDNTDALPGEEQMTNPDTVADLWFALENGAYRVTVRPIDHKTDANPGGETEAFGTLADYVIVFEPIEDISLVVVAQTPPQLHPFLDWTPVLPLSMGTEARFTWPESVPGADIVAALEIDPASAILPTQSINQTVDPALAEMAFPEDRSASERLKTILVGPSLAPGQLAVLGWINGLSYKGDRVPLMRITGRHVVRIAAMVSRTDLNRARLVLVPKPDMSAEAEAVDRLRTQLLAAAGAPPPGPVRLAVPSFEQERLATLTSAEAVTTWALMKLDMPFEARVGIYASAATARIAAIERYLTDGVSPPPAPGRAMGRIARWLGGRR